MTIFSAPRTVSGAPVRAFFAANDTNLRQKVHLPLEYRRTGTPAEFGLAEFRDLAEMRDGIVEARPAPNNGLFSSPGRRAEHELLVRGIEALREGRGFVFDTLDIFKKISADGATAFSEGYLGLPYATFAGLAKLTADDKPGAALELVLIVAEEVPNMVENGLTMGSGLVHGVRPKRCPGGGVSFIAIGRLMRVLPGDDSYFFAKPVEPPSNAYEIATTEISLRALFAMLALVSDTRIAVSREIPDARLNSARVKCGKVPIPALWKINTKTASALYTTPIGPKQAHGENRGRHHRPPVPHSRRGHQRKLSTGRLTWVRSCSVGEITRHLVRGREFYRVDHTGTERAP